MVEFSNPWLFLLLLPLLAVTVICLKRRPAAILFSDTDSVKKSGAKSGFSFMRALPDLLLFVAGVLIVIALSGPRKGLDLTKERTEGVDIMLLIDVSGSMRSMDVPEKLKTNREIEKALRNDQLPPRMDVAKKELKEFVKKRPNDRIGLIAFAGLPFTVCPPTLDHEFLTGHLNVLEAGMFRRTASGTALASPIAIATNSLKNSDAKRRVMVLFTDGSNTVDDTITPEQAAELATNYNITIYTVGIGSDRALALTGFGGAQFVQNDFDEPLLKKIAETTKGLYLKASDQEKFAEAMEQINKLEKVTIIQPQFKSYKQLFPKFLLVAIILAAIAFILEHTFCLRIP